MTILLREDGTCGCTAAGKCPLGKCGSDLCCTKEDLEKLGYDTFVPGYDTFVPETRIKMVVPIGETIRKARVKTIQKGMIEYYLPQVEKKFLLVKWWQNIYMWMSNGEVLWRENICETRERAMKDLQDYEKLTGDKLAIVGRVINE